MKNTNDKICNTSGMAFGKLLVTIFVIFSLSILGAIDAYFILNSSKVSTQLYRTKCDFDKIVNDNQALKDSYNKLKSDYTRVEQELSTKDEDRANLVSQIKKLQDKEERAAQVKVDLEDNKKELRQAQKQEQQTFYQAFKLKQKIKSLEDENAGLVKEKVDLQNELDTQRSTSFVALLEQDKQALSKENEELTAKLKKTIDDFAQLKESALKTKQDYERDLKDFIQAKEELKTLKANYAAAFKKNKILERKVVEIPKKFVEIARQNKVLMRQTANMHYNLGVFYSKQKEYARAAGEFERAIELAPDDAYSHFNLGYIYAEYLVNRPKAIEHFRNYLRYAKAEDKDVDWVRKYILTWDTLSGKKVIE